MNFILFWLTLSSCSVFSEEHGEKPNWRTQEKRAVYCNKDSQASVNIQQHINEHFKLARDEFNLLSHKQKNKDVVMYKMQNEGDTGVIFHNATEVIIALINCHNASRTKCMDLARYCVSYIKDIHKVNDTEMFLFGKPCIHGMSMKMFLNILQGKIQIIMTQRRIRRWLCKNICDKYFTFKKVFSTVFSIHNNSNNLVFNFLCQLPDRKEKGELYLVIFRCKYNHKPSRQSVTDSLFETSRVQRKLLSVNDLSNAKEIDVGSVTVDLKDAGSRLERDSYGDTGNWENKDNAKPFNYSVYLELMEYLRRKRSKDPVWAMFSVMLLMGVLVGAAWVCGLRKIDTEKLINVNIDEHFHYVSVRDILRSKKKYLSKKIQQYKRRHKYRKHKYRRLKYLEDIERDVVSDNSEDERLIYANDF